MKVLLTKYKGLVTLVNLGDIVILLRSPEEHINHVQQVSTLSHDAGVDVKLKNANYSQIISIISVMLFAQGPSKYRPQQMINMRTQIPDYIDGTPIIAKAVNVLRRFRPSFARITVLLSKKLRSGQGLTFDRQADKEVTALEMLKAKLVEPNVWALPYFQSAYKIDTSAWNN